MALTRLDDVIVPEVFNPYVVRRTAERSALLQSGAIQRSPVLDGLLAGGGATFTVPFFKDLARLESNVSSDEEDDFYTGGSNNSVPRKIGTGTETQVRQSRNASWASADLVAALAGEDPMQVIGELVAEYWQWDLQASLISTMRGVFADNEAAPVGTEHEQGDLGNDISGGELGTFAAGETNIGSSAFIDAKLTMGDAMGGLSLMMLHPVAYAGLVKQNGVETIRPADGSPEFQAYQGATIIVSDYMPHNGGVFETWLFGPGAIALGLGTPKVPTETERRPNSSNGGGSEVLFNRQERVIHPVGHRYVGPAGAAGPSNAALANGASWERAFSERKQIRIARLITREF